MTRARQLIALTIILLFSSFSSYAETLAISDPEHTYRLGPHLEVLVDEGGKITVDKLRSGNYDDAFVANNSDNIDGYFGKTLWVRLRLEAANNDASKHLWYLQPYHDSNDIFIIDRSGVTRGGHNNPIIEDRPVKHRRGMLPIDLSIHDYSTVYFKVIPHSNQVRAPNLISAIKFWQQDSHYTMIVAILMGFALGLVIYNAIVFFFIRDNAYLYYVLFQLFMATALLSLERILPQLLGDARYNWHTMIASSYLAIAAACFYAAVFLNMASYLPRLDKCIRLFAAINVLLFFASMVFGGNFFLGIAMDYFSLPLILTLVIAATLIYRAGYRPALFYLIAWGPYFLFSGLYLAAQSGLIDHSTKTIPMFIFSFALEALLNSIALGARIRFLEKNKEKLIKDKLAAEQSSNDLKTEFLATISHELRTPVHGIIASHDLIAEQWPQLRDSEEFAMARQSSENMARLVDRLLLFADASDHRLLNEPVASPLATELGEMVAEFSTQYPDIDIAISGNIFTSPHRRHFAIDSRKLLAAVSEVVDNACRYSEQGRVDLQADYQQAEAKLTLIIFDHGGGISLELKNNLEQAFSQSDQSFSRQHQGLGLGIALSFALIRCIGGHIGVATEAGMGTTVTITAPASIEDAVTIDRHSNRKHRTLIAEDNPINQKILAAQLNKLDCEVTLADDGQQAQQLFKQHKFDIVFMDCQMPNVDGITATKNIRRYEAVDKRTPIIAVTANTMSGDRQRCLEAGMDDFLAKPIKSEQLRSALAKHCS